MLLSWKGHKLIFREGRAADARMFDRKIRVVGICRTAILGIRQSNIIDILSAVFSRRGAEIEGGKEAARPPAASPTYVPAPPTRATLQHTFKSHMLILTYVKFAQFSVNILGVSAACRVRFFGK